LNSGEAWERPPKQLPRPSSATVAKSVRSGGPRASTDVPNTHDKARFRKARPFGRLIAIRVFLEPIEGKAGTESESRRFGIHCHKWRRDDG
jgi:hypothetical protein